MKILITGNAGYVGPVVVSHLTHAHPDWIIEGFDAGFFARSLSEPNAEPEKLLARQHWGDLRDAAAIPLEGVDAIVHLAGLSNDPMGNRFTDLTEEINIRATEALIRRARDVGVRNFVFASSCSMYGATSGEARTEGDDLNPLTPYARSKVAIEEQLRVAAGSAFTVTCLRFATACGASPRLRLDLVLNDFVASALSTGRVVILSDGSPWRPLIDVQDMARAIDWGLSDRGHIGEAYVAVNTGSDGWNYQVRDLARSVAERIPGTTVEFASEAPVDTRSYRVNFSLFRQLAPDHQPVVTIDRSINQLVLHMQSGGESFDWSRTGRFNRLHEIQRLQDAQALDENLRWTDTRTMESHD